MLRDATLWGVSLCAAVVLFAVVAARWRRFWGRRRKRLRAGRARAAEQQAAALLRSAGYTVVGEQVRTTVPVEVDHQSESFTLIADYLVSRWGRRWVAEVKTGNQALSLRHGPTRRQLLEYSVAFGVRGVLLVDAEAGRIWRVRFPAMVARKRSLSGLVVSAVLGAAAVAVLYQLLPWASSWVEGLGLR